MKISVIVPIYNVERYLSRCLDSIINQSFKELEIILVDDGSTDSSGKICEDYKELDPRIKVIHKKNGGLSDARNAGLDVATGEYISFIDSDDYIHHQMLEILLKNLIHYNADISECERIKTKLQNVEDGLIKNSNITVFNKEEALANSIMDQNLKTYVWNKLYKKELWEKIRFPFGKIFEDAFTTYKVINLSNKVVKTNEILYYYYQRDDSIVSANLRNNFSIKSLDHCEALLEVSRFIKKEHEALLPLIAVKLSTDLTYYIYQLMKNRDKIDKINGNYKEILNNLIKMISDENLILYLRQPIKKICRRYLKNNYKKILINQREAFIKLYAIKKSKYMFYCLYFLIDNMKTSLLKLRILFS